MENNTGTNPLTNIGRIHYLDQVRALALMMGILIHGCYTYAYGVQGVWLLTDQTSSIGITMGFFFAHLFRMCVFFLIAGFFANYLYQKRGTKGFLKHRLKRLGLPFVIFLPLLLIIYIAVQIFVVFYVPEEKMNQAVREAAVTAKAQIAEAMARHSGDDFETAKDGDTTVQVESEKLRSESSTQLNDMQKIKVTDNTDKPKHTGIDPRTEQSDPMITLHLWFLYNLILFCIAAAILQRFNYPFITKAFNTFFSSPIYLWLLPLLMVPALYSIPVPSPPPSHFIPRLWSFSYYGVFFLLGWHFFYHRDYLDKVDKHLGVMIVFSIIASVLYLYFTPTAEAFRNSIPSEMAGTDPITYTFSRKVFLVFLEAYLSVFLTMIFLVLGKRYLNFSNKFMRFISDSSYWIYLIHWPLVTFIQAFLVTSPISGYFKFAISSALVLGIGALTYRYMVRYTFIGTLLNGKRVKGVA